MYDKNRKLVIDTRRSFQMSEEHLIYSALVFLFITAMQHVAKVQ